MSDGDGSVIARSEELDWISWLRIVAICGVVAIHTTGYNVVAPDARSTLRGVLAIWLDLGAAFAVPLFVMLSGALLLDPARYRGPEQFLRKRVMRLGPALVFWHVWYFLIILWVKGEDLAVGDAVVRALNGNLYTALYFFWIILGLGLVTPLLMPYVASASRRGLWTAALALTAMTAATQATVQWRGAENNFADWALTWWFPYLGMFMLGFAIRGVVLRGWALGGAVAGVLFLAWLLPWQWRNPNAPSWLVEFFPGVYYGASTILYACLLFLVFQALIRGDGLARFLTRPRVARAGRTLGDATLGVFALHLTVLLVVLELPVIGGDPEAPRALFLLARLGAVIVLTFAVVIPLRRLPVVRAVL